MKTPKNRNSYAQLQNFVFIVLPDIVEFIHKDMFFLKNMATKQGLPQ